MSEFQRSGALFAVKSMSPTHSNSTVVHPTSMLHYAIIANICEMTYENTLEKSLAYAKNCGISVSDIQVWSSGTTYALSFRTELPCSPESSSSTDSQSLETYVVSVRGTVHAHDVLLDINSIAEADWLDYNGNWLGRAGSGFITAYDCLRKDIQDKDFIKTGTADPILNNYKRLLGL